MCGDTSCVVHRLNPEVYLEQVLRLAPHWPTTRMLELSPKYWKRTVDALDERGRRIITPPWLIAPSTVTAKASHRRLVA